MRSRASLARTRWIADRRSMASPRTLATERMNTTSSGENSMDRLIAASTPNGRSCPGMMTVAVELKPASTMGAYTAKRFSAPRSFEITSAPCAIVYPACDPVGSSAIHSGAEPADRRVPARTDRRRSYGLCWMTRQASAPTSPFTVRTVSANRPSRSLAARASRPSSATAACCRTRSASRSSARMRSVTSNMLVTTYSREPSSLGTGTESTRIQISTPSARTSRVRTSRIARFSVRAMLEAISAPTSSLPSSAYRRTPPACWVPTS